MTNARDGHESMLLPNNNELDTDSLNEKIARTAGHRRRPKPLATRPDTATLTEIPRDPKSVRREAIKRIPVLGPLLTWGYRQIRNLTVPGLGWKQRIRLVPGLGAFAVWLNALLRLTSWRQQVMLELENLQRQQQAQAERYAALTERLDNDIGQQLRQTAEQLRQIEASNAERDNRIGSLVQKMRHQMQAPSPAGALQAPAASAPANVDLDTFYVEFEEKFRGTRDDIRERLKVYLPYLAHLRQNNEATAIDIGCGRGEWLELLRDNGIRARGIDLNSAMVDACRDRGLEAECADAIAWLQKQPEGSLAVITGFQIIEHLPFTTLIALFDAALYALRDDGLIIFETPNPENLMVGACNFYYDPTHQHPIVPTVAEFIARQRGFARAEILRLHPYPDHFQLSADSEVNRRVNQALYGPQDYAVLAWKKHGN
ncbi:MAG: class I SAM-dependent methyltransferase [Burkholderiaceae bacterium]|nr:class I SAM-dependent methyltransferase [Burkholderiaceae bacterium]